MRALPYPCSRRRRRSKRGAFVAVAASTFASHARGEESAAVWTTTVGRDSWMAAVNPSTSDTRSVTTCPRNRVVLCAPPITHKRDWVKNMFMNGLHVGSLSDDRLIFVRTRPYGQSRNWFQPVSINTFGIRQNPTLVKSCAMRNLTVPVEAWSLWDEFFCTESTWLYRQKKRIQQRWGHSNIAKVGCVHMLVLYDSWKRLQNKTVQINPAISLKHVLWHIVFSTTFRKNTTLLESQLGHVFSPAGNILSRSRTVYEIDSTTVSSSKETNRCCARYPFPSPIPRIGSQRKTWHIMTT